MTLPRRKTIKSLTTTKLSSDLPMVDVMVDLETLGRRAGCAVLSIGAVEFGPGGLGREFYTVINRPSQRELGLFEDESTLKWWATQSEDACRVLFEAEQNQAVTLSAALGAFTNFLVPIGLKRVKVWGCGSDFDNAILTNLYAAVKADPPWDFWNNRCYRTLKSLIPSEKPRREGTYHNALDDAKTQALHAIQLLQKL